MITARCESRSERLDVDNNGHPQINRRYYLDWLRAIMILLVFLGHSMMPFIYGADWHITNPDRSMAVTAFIGFCFLWGMSLVFLIAGASAGASLRSRGPGRYLHERFTRLVIPFVAGMLTIVPLQKYFECLHNKTFGGSFFAFYPRFFHDARFGWNLDLHLDTYHLWFIQFLFDFCVITLPLFLWLGSPKGRRTIPAIAVLMAKPGALFLCAVPLALVQAALRPIYPNYGDWADFYYWIMFFIFGWFVTADRRFEQTIVRNGVLGLVVGVAGFATLAYLLSTGHVEHWQDSPSYSIGSFAYATLTSLISLSWVLFFTCVGKRFLDFKTRWLNQLNEAVLPFYILHHFVITIVAFFIVRLSWGILPKFLLILVPSFLITVAVYAYPIRMVSPLRWMFGMRAAPRPTTVLAEAPSTSTA